MVNVVHSLDALYKHAPRHGPPCSHEPARAQALIHDFCPIAWRSDVLRVLDHESWLAVERNDEAVSSELGCMCGTLARARRQPGAVQAGHGKLAR